MQISLANLLTFPPVHSRATTSAQVDNGSVSPQERGLGRVVPAASTPKHPPQISAENPVPATASVVLHAPAPSRDEGVTYTRTGTFAGKPSVAASPGVPDLGSMTLEKQLRVGRDMGVFTKITLHNDGVLVAKPDASGGGKTPEFVASAVATIKDFQEGFATLSQRDALFV